MLVAADAELRGFTGEDAVGEVLGSVPVPRSLAGV